jgi:hypothetical protein
MHAAAFVLPAGDTAPEEHAIHDAFPGPYVLALHLTHSAIKYSHPAMHVQSALPGDANEFVGHVLHGVGPGAVLYVFSRHSVHAAGEPVHPALHRHVDLSTAGNVLAAQGMQTPGPTPALYESSSHRTHISAPTDPDQPT